MKYQTEYMRTFQVPDPSTSAYNRPVVNKNDLCEEPILQKKKRVKINSDTLKLTDASSLTEEKQINLKKAPQPTQSLDIQESRKKLIRDDQFILLGPQDKLYSNNIAYPLRASITNKLRSEQQDGAHHASQTGINQDDNKKNEKTTNEKEANSVEQIKEKTENETKSVVSPKNKTSKIKKSLSKHTPASLNNLQKLNENIPAPKVNVDTGAVQNNISEVKEKVIHKLPMSEYQKSFLWKIQSKSSPVVNASINEKERVEKLQRKDIDQSKTKNDQDTQNQGKPQKKFEKRGFVSEYASNYVDTTNQINNNYNFKKKETSKTKQLVDENNSKPHVEETLNPQRPFGPHGKLRRWKSEYQLSYKPFLNLKSSIIQNEEAKKDSNYKNSEWFKNIIELRQKAKEYKTRSYGVNFSPDHTLQLISNSLNTWDVNSDTSSPRKLTKAQEMRSHSAEPVKVEKLRLDSTTFNLDEPVSRMPVSTEPIKPAKTQTVKPIKIESVRVNQDQEKTISSKNLHIFRSIENLNSAQIKKSMIWETESQESSERNDVNSRRNVQLSNEVKAKVLKENDSKQRESRLFEKNDRLQKNTEKNDKSISKNNAVNKTVQVSLDKDRDHYSYAPHHIETIEYKKKYVDYTDKHHDKKVRETFGKTYIKEDYCDDLDSISQLSTRSLASSSSLLDRTRENRDKFWGKDMKR